MWANEQSYIDLTFDRWSGALRIALAPDGKTASPIDASQPVALSLFGTEIVLRFPELYELRTAFDPMLLAEVPPAGPAPTKAEHLALTRVADGTVLTHRPAPEHGVVVRLRPGQTFRVARRPGRPGDDHWVVVWGLWQVGEVQSLTPDNGPWEHRNNTAGPQTLFVAGVSGKTKYPMTCQVRERAEKDGTRVLEFDEDYAGRFADFAAEVTVRGPE
jgi:hypothetical protein